MIAAAYGSVSDIEIAWVLIALVGLAYSLFNVREALADIDWLETNKISNGRRQLAKYQLAAECLRSAVQLLFVTVGILAMFVPETPDMLALPTLQVVLGFLIRWGLITASIMLTIKSYLGKRVRDVLKGR